MIMLLSRAGRKRDNPKEIDMNDYEKQLIDIAKDVGEEAGVPFDDIEVRREERFDEAIDMWALGLLIIIGGIGIIIAIAEIVRALR